MRLLRPAFIITFLVSLLACSASISKKEISSIQTVGIINQFPDYPMYAEVSLSIRKPKYPTVNDAKFKRSLTNEVAEKIRQQGYQVVDNVKAPADVDLLIEIKPATIKNLKHSFAYGFYHRELLGVVSSSYTYVALNLVTTLHGKSECNDCTGESVSELEINGWRTNWIELPRMEKTKLENALNSNIKQAVDSAFSKLDL